MSRFNLRFRRSIRLGKFLRMNFGKRGVSVTAGVPGAHETVHVDGRRTTSIGIPGSGISAQRVEQIGGPRGRARKEPQIAHDDPPDRSSLARRETSDRQLIIQVSEEIRDRESNAGS